MIAFLFKFFTLRLDYEAYLSLGKKHFLFGVLATWLVGMGRYWDDTEAGILQHLGLGSVIYIFVLAFLIYIVVYPLKPKGWTYFRVVTFISLTSFPAVLYALPVEKWVPLETAIRINTWFLIVVALWRVVLLFHFLLRFAKLGFTTVLIVALLPLTLIIVVLTMLNLERAVFDIMRGMHDQTPDDGAYLVLVNLTAISVVLFLPLVISYLFTIHRRRKKAKE